MPNFVVSFSTSKVGKLRASLLVYALSALTRETRETSFGLDLVLRNFLLLEVLGSSPSWSLSSSSPSSRWDSLDSDILSVGVIVGPLVLSFL